MKETMTKQYCNDSGKTKSKASQFLNFLGAPSLCLLFAFTINCQFTEPQTQAHVVQYKKRKNENTNETYIKLVLTDKSTTRRGRGTATRRGRGTATSPSLPSSSPSSTELPAKTMSIAQFILPLYCHIWASTVQLYCHIWASTVQLYWASTVQLYCAIDYHFVGVVPCPEPRLPK